MGGPHTAGSLACTALRPLPPSFPIFRNAPQASISSSRYIPGNTQNLAPCRSVVVVEAMPRIGGRCIRKPVTAADGAAVPCGAPECQGVSS